jgi:magnesium transporter
MTEATKSIALVDTAAEHMTASIPMAHAERAVADVFHELRGKRFECADTVFVVAADGRLEGIVRINDLLAADGGTVGEIMVPEHDSVRPEDDQEAIAALAMQYGMIAVPVVDDHSRLIGAVPPEALFHILREEHMEDLQRIAGITPHEDGDAYLLNEPLMARFRRRIPWLLFGLAASSLVTMVMVGFERSLAANVSVAFFVPALVYIAGAIGSQAVSVAVRRLSLGSVGIVRLVRDETLIGTAIGTTLGVAGALAVLVLFGDARLALAVGLAVMAAGTVSAVIGFSLPWAFQRAGFDPALGSGPVCTVIQDITSLLIYFTFVVLVVL